MPRTVKGNTLLLLSQIDPVLLILATDPRPTGKAYYGYMSLQQAVLGVLEARPMTGYELTRFFESTARWVWSAPQSQIYPLLRKLEMEGLIAGEEQVRGSKLRRTSYSITTKGLADLKDWLVAPHDEPNMRDPLLLQTLFFDMVDPDAADSVLREHISVLQSSVDQWSVHRARLLARDTPLLRERLLQRNPSDHARIATLKAHVFDYLIQAARLRMDWAEKAIRIVHDQPADPAGAAVSA